ncbi:MAG: segregation/condensation protein A [Lachnospiraceae bacterium]|nr:segregation/condensation protein A [Lachnospiraceae bacterium]
MEITLQLENFQGPMSLLYHLIEKNKIDIYDIPIFEITNQYLAIVEDAQKRSMDVMSEFLLMAANLLEIKSRMLLPKAKNEDSENEIDPRAELVSKLIEYKRFKNVTEEFKEREEAASQVLYKEADPSLSIFKQEEVVEIEDFLDGVSFDDIYKAFQEVLRRKEKKVDRVRSSFKSVERDLYTVEEKISYIKDLIIISTKIRFWEIFRENVRKTEIVVTFMALLECIKMKIVSISQDGAFNEIVITKYIGSEINEA